MTTMLRSTSTPFVITPALDRLITRIMRYLQSGYAVHLRGAAGSGKTTLAMHLANRLNRPTAIVFGDDEFTSTDLIGNQSGYTRKKVVDNFIHNVVKVEDELKLSWVDSRLTLACKEGYTLVYDEFNRSRPEVNNVLLSALEEKILALPPKDHRNEYLQVHPEFRIIFTSNPEEYCGVHSTQDALLDRMITIDIPEPDELTQLEILVNKTGISRIGALAIARLVKAFRSQTGNEKVSGLRSSLMLARICQDHQIVINPESTDFRETCQDILVAKSALPSSESTEVLWTLLNQPESMELDEFEPLDWFESLANTKDSETTLESESELELDSSDEDSKPVLEIDREIETENESELESELEDELEAKGELELEEGIEPEAELETEAELEAELEPEIVDASPSSIDTLEEFPTAAELASLVDGSGIDAIAIITDEDATAERILESVNESNNSEIASMTLSEFVADLNFEDSDSEELEYEILDTQPTQLDEQATASPIEPIPSSIPQPNTNSVPQPNPKIAEPEPRIDAKAGNVFEALTALLDADAPSGTQSQQVITKSLRSPTAKQRKTRSPKNTSSKKSSSNATAKNLDEDCDRLLTHLQQVQSARLTDLETALNLKRSAVMTALKHLMQQGKIVQRNHRYSLDS
jgi:gas vesicle protein GvpN